MCIPHNKLRWYPQQPQRFIFTDLSEACCEAKRWKHISWVSVSSMNLTWLGFCNLLRNPLNLTWLCTRLPGTFSGTFSGTFPGTLLNLTWLCTKASQTFSGTFSGSLLNVDLLRNLIRNPVEPNLATKASHTSAEPSPGILQIPLPDLLRNLLRNPVEPDLALHQSRIFSTTLLNPT